jgi:uncharacterized protein with HEPN domain
MNDETRKNLIDILQAAEEIQDFVHGMELRRYRFGIFNYLEKK